ncbi:MAG: hypothetical protein ACR2MF_05150 [Chthoniobacterales bacterium]
MTEIISGFPLVLIFASTFEITPEGIKRPEEVRPTEWITTQTGRKLVVITVLLAHFQKFCEDKQP